MLVIWDLDGTLVDSLPVTLEAFRDATEPYLGRRLSDSEVTAHFGQSEERILARIVGEASAAACYRRVVELMSGRLTDVRPFAGIPETLRVLVEAGYRLALCTGRGRHGTGFLLRHLGFDSHFLKVITSDDVENPKPHPEGVLRICSELGAGPGAAVMVGDTPADVRAGRLAGIHSIGCAWDAMADARALEEAGASRVIREPRELFDWLGLPGAG